MNPRWHWIPAIAALFALAILLLSAVAVERVQAMHERTVAAQMESNLTTLANLLRVMQRNYLGSASSLARDPDMRSYLAALAARPADAALQREFDDWVRRSIANYGFTLYTIYDADLVIRAAHDPVYVGARSGLGGFFDQLRRTGAAISYPFRTRRTRASTAMTGQRDYVQLACNVVDGDEALLGYFCLGSDPRQVLFPLLLGSWTGKTGEAYLVDRDGRLRTPSRFESEFEALRDPPDSMQVSRLMARVPGREPAEDGSLPLPTPGDPLTRMAASLIADPLTQVRVLNGYSDYRGNRVVGAGTWLEELDLGLIVEVDANELYQPAHLATFWIWTLAVAACALLLALAYKDARTRRELARSEAQLASFFANAPLSMHIQTADGRFLRTNPNFERAAASLRGSPQEGGEEQDVAEMRRRQRDEVLAAGHPLRFNVDYVDADGEAHHLHLVRFPIQVPGEEQPLGVGTVGIEVTSEVRARRELQRLAEELEGQVATRTAELSEARDAAELAGRAKADFLANMSHEIRTPLNAITGMTHLAGRLNRDPRIAHYLQRIDTAGGHLLGIVNDILDFSKIEAGAIELQMGVFSPEQILQDVAALIGPRAGSKRLELLLVVAPGVPSRMVGDAMRIGQVLINFAANGVKFTEEGTVELRVDCLAENDSIALVSFEVEDTGPGLSPGQLSSLFQPFTQGDSSRRRTHEGTGLGLAISKRLAESMGGRVSASSRLGEGSVFKLELPLTVAAEPASAVASALLHGRALVVDDHPRAAEHVATLVRRLGMQAEVATSPAQAAARLLSLDGDRIDWLLVTRECDRFDPHDSGRRLSQLAQRSDPPAGVLLLLPPGAEHEPDDEGAGLVLSKPVTRASLLLALRPGPASDALAAPAEGQDPLQGMHVLLVEDNEVNREVANDLLQTRGVRVTSARDGMQALQLLGRETFDAVLMDLHMPVIDGIEATRALRRDPALAQLPVIGLSASVQPQDRERAMAGGMNAFVGKPIVPNQLFAALEAWVRAGHRSAANADATPAAAHDASDARLVAALRADPELAVADAISLLLGREALYARLVRRVVAERACDTGALRAALDAGALEAAARTVHNFAAVAGSLGAATLRQACLAVEQQLRAGEVEEVALNALMHRMQSLGERLARAIDVPPFDLRPPSASSRGA